MSGSWGKCPVCRQIIPENWEGNLRQHLDTARGWCPASGQPYRITAVTA